MHCSYADRKTLGKLDWPDTSAAEGSWTIGWRAPGLREYGFAGVETGAGKVNSESVDVLEKVDVPSSWLSLYKSPEVELKSEEERTIIFSSETWLDMLYIILRHTRSYPLYQSNTI